VSPWRSRAADLVGGCRFNEPLRGKTTLGVGGPAAVWAETRERDVLAGAVTLAESCGLPWMVLGGGSNVLVSDAGYPGCAFRLGGGLADVAIDGMRISAGGGAALGMLCRRAAEAGLGGLEPLAGIPGTVGGAVVGNAGAWGCCVSDVIESVTVLTGGRLSTVPASGLGHSYRAWGLGDAVIVSATFDLSPDDPMDVRARMDEYFERRRVSQPIGERSAGCVFRNPEPMSAGRLLDEAGCKGQSVGGAVVSDVHANFILTSDAATASDVFSLMRRMADAVFDAFGVTLHPEVRLVGMDWPAGVSEDTAVHSASRD